MQKQEDFQSDFKNDKTLKKEWTRPMLALLDMEETSISPGSGPDGGLASSIGSPS